MYKKFKMLVVYILTVCFIALSCTMANVKGFDLDNDQADLYGTWSMYAYDYYR